MFSLPESVSGMFGLSMKTSMTKIKLMVPRMIMMRMMERQRMLVLGKHWGSKLLVLRKKRSKWHVLKYIRLRMY